MTTLLKWEFIFLWFVFIGIFGVNGRRFDHRHKRKDSEVPSKCQKEANVPSMPGRYIPQCDDDGNYKRKQCHGSTGYCWCVSLTGVEVPGTKKGPTEDDSNCDSASAGDEVQDEEELYFNGVDQTNKDSAKEAAEVEITADDLPKDGELFEGDMVMDSELRRAVLGEEEKKSAVESSVEGHARHWKNGVVPYVIGKSLKRLLRKRVKEAVEIFKYYTCINYRPKVDGDVDYVVIEDGKGCSSSVGRVGNGEQTIHLALGCSRIGTVLHEMMHVLGIIHEQSRDDRDDYLNINFKNIKRKLLRNFQKYDFARSNDLDMPYNYFSVMHYSNYAFSKNDEPTLEAKYDHELVFGQRKFWSHLDVKQINKLYHCNKKYKETLLHSDMTPKMILEKRRDNLKDVINKWERQESERYF